jgi:hypothetical protein
MPAAPVALPLSGPTTSGTLITVDEALQQPTRITRDIAQLAEQNLFAAKLFGMVPINGGAVIYDTPPTVASDLFANTPVQEVAPLQEFPIQNFLRGVPTVARPRKIGGKFPVSDEARDRNDTRYLQRAMVQEANTFAVTIDSMAMAVVNAAISANTRTVAGQSWGTAAGVTIQNTSGTNQAVADIITARTTLQLEERGKSINAIIVHPNQYLSLSEAGLLRGLSPEQLLAAAGIDDVTVSQRITAGTAILYDRNSPPGGWANEKPLSQETWREQEVQGTWYQWDTRLALFLDDFYGIWQLTGLA